MTTRRAWVAVCATITVAGTAASALAAEGDDQGASISLLRLIFSGGWAMIPLAACSLAVIMFVVRILMDLKPARYVPETVLPMLQQAVAARDVGAAWQQAQAAPSTLSTVLMAGLAKARPEDPLASAPKMDAAMDAALTREETAAAAGINYLSVVASIAPMLGLLGTVSGMIKAFQKIGVGGMGKPELLAGNIGEALVTTATGLVIAIPAMFFYYLFRNRLTGLVSRTQDQLEHLLDLFTGEASLAAYTAPPGYVPPPGGSGTPPAPPSGAGS
jgi:biopolymer transport protein ExbB